MDAILEIIPNISNALIALIGIGAVNFTIMTFAMLLSQILEGLFD